jgi:cytochrome c
MFKLILAALSALSIAGPALADPQVADGQRLWRQHCAECHALDSNETGPRHRGVFGRRSGSVAGYDYSPALRKAGVQWDAVSLDRWLSDPEQFIPGQNMDFKVASSAERTALIAYLKSISEPVQPAPHTTRK